MPLVEFEGPLQSSAPSMPQELRPFIVEQGGVSLGEQLAAAFERDNWTASAFNLATAPDFEPEAGFNPIDHLTQEEVENDGFLLSAISRQHLDWLRKKRDRERELEELIERGPLPGWLATLLSAGVADPVNFIPFGAAAKVATGGKTVLQAARRGAAVAGAANLGVIAAEEAVMQADQLTRTWEESIAAAVLGGALGAAAGGGAGALLARARQNKVAQAAVEDVAALIRSAREDVGSAGEGTLSAARAGFTREFTGEATEAIGPKFLGSVARKLGDWGLLGPGFALSFSEDPIVRELAHRLVSTGVVTKGHLEGLTPGASLDMLIRTRKAQYQTMLVDIFNAGYAEALRTNPQLSRDGFHQEVALALMSGDKHADPAIAKVAQVVRAKILAPLGKEAKELSLIDGLLFGPDGVAEDASYLPQRILADKVNANLTEFRQRVFNYLKPIFEKYNQLVDRAETLRKEAEELRVKVREMEERLAAQTAATPPELPGRPILKAPAEMRNEVGRSLDRSARRYIEAKAKFRDALSTHRQLQRQLKDMEQRARDLPQTVDPSLLGAQRKRVAESRAKVEALFKKVHDARKDVRNNQASLRALGGLPRSSKQAFRDRIEAMRADLQIKEQEARAITEQVGDLVHVDDLDIRQIIEGYIDTLNRNDISRFTSFRAEFGSLRKRSISLPADIVRDFGDTDAFNIISTYINGMVADLETQRMFGWINPPVDDVSNPFEAVMRSAKNRATELADKAADLEAQGNVAQAKELREQAAEVVKRAERDVNMLEELFRRIRGTNAHRIPPSMLGLYRAAEQARNLNFMRLMGSAVLSNIPDFARVAATHGLVRTFGVLARDVVQGFKTFRLAKAEARKLGVAVETILNQRMLVMESLDEAYRGRTKLEAFLTKRATPFMSRLFLLPQWSDAMKALDSLLTTDEILRAVRDLADGKIVAPRRRRMLAQVGIDEEMAKRLAAHRDKWIETDGLLQANLDAWRASDEDAAEALITAIHTHVADVVITPGAGDIPAWMDRTEIGKVVGQFRKWLFASTGRVLLQMVQKASLGEYGSTMTHISALLVAGMTAQALRDIAADGKIDTHRSIGGWIWGGIDRGGLLGLLIEADAMAGLTTGYSLSRLVSGELPPRFRQRTAVDQALGPTFGIIDQALAFAGTLTEKGADPKTVWALRRLLPAQNWFVLNYALDELTGYQAHQDTQRAKRERRDQRLSATAETSR